MRRTVVLGILATAALLTIGCGGGEPKKEAAPAEPPLGKIDRKDPALDALIAPDAKIEKLASGFKFIEGPVWIAKDGGYLLFSDIPNNSIMKWTPDGKVAEYLKPSGYNGKEPLEGYIGSNGLLLDKEGRLIICQHGDGKVVRQEPDGKLTVLAEKYQGKRLNSPNDAVYKSNGDLYFTDPPYGFPKQDEDPRKQLKFNGIFRLTAKGKLDLLNKDQTRPNGIAFSPDEKTLYVANSDPAKKNWMKYDVQADGTIKNGTVFFDATAEAADGLPDGMKVDGKGNLYCTGPGGVWIFAPDGKHLGTIAPPEVPANVGWGDDGKTLYMTAREGLYRIKTLAGK